MTTDAPQPIDESTPVDAIDLDSLPDYTFREELDDYLDPPTSPGPDEAPEQPEGGLAGLCLDRALGGYVRGVQDLIEMEVDPTEAAKTIRDVTVATVQAVVEMTRLDRSVQVLAHLAEFAANVKEARFAPPHCNSPQSGPRSATEGEALAGYVAAFEQWISGEHDPVAAHFSRDTAVAAFSVEQIEALRMYHDLLEDEIRRRGGPEAVAAVDVEAALEVFRQSPDRPAIGGRGAIVPLLALAMRAGRELYQPEALTRLSDHALVCGWRFAKGALEVLFGPRDEQDDLEAARAELEREQARTFDADEGEDARTLRQHAKNAAYAEAYGAQVDRPAGDAVS